MTVVELLQAAKKRIEKPECWTQSHVARGVTGNPVKATAPNAVCWCAVGAIEAEGAPEQLRHLAGYMLRQVCGARPEFFNDTRTHPEVLAAFDRAIALAQQEQPCS